MPSSTPSQVNNPHWNPTIAAPRRSSPIVEPLTTIPRSSPSPSAACWDWFLYSPELDSHLHTPSSSFVQSIKQHDDDLDLLLCLPSWLLVLLSPSNQRIRSTDDENETDQEMTSLQHYYPDEPFLSLLHVDNGSSQSTLSSESASTDSFSSQLQEEKNRSSTPDTDDGYQSASDASRSDYSQQTSLPYEPLMTRKDQTRVNGPAGSSSASMTHRISYAAAVKPVSSTPSPTGKSNSLASGSGVKGKQTIPSSPSNDSSSNANGQKLKFIAPRFERMHHAKQYLPSTTMTSKDSSLLTNRSQSRSNNLVQRQPMIQSTRRRWEPTKKLQNSSNHLLLSLSLSMVFFLCCSFVFICFYVVLEPSQLRRNLIRM